MSASEAVGSCLGAPQHPTVAHLEPLRRGGDALTAGPRRSAP
nr:hypothetical protein [Streptomyces adelaidensis]